MRPHQRENTRTPSESTTTDLVSAFDEGEPETAKTACAFPALARLRQSANGRFNSGAFSDHAKASAESSGCHFLFDFPAALIDSSADEAAAILCPFEHGFNVLFLCFEASHRRIRVVTSEEAPDSLIDFAFSFASVLTYLPLQEETSLN